MSSMHVDERYPWLLPAVVVTPPTAEELAQLRLLAEHDAPTREGCETCANTGRYFYTRTNSRGFTIVDRYDECPDCGGSSVGSQMPEIWDEMRAEPFEEVQP